MAEEVNRAWKDQYMLRFPDGMRDQIKQAAEFSGRSMNAEIIHRLKFTFDEREHEKLRLDLPADLWNSLMVDSGVQGVQMDERAIQILQGAYDGNEGHTNALEKVRTLVTENAEMMDLIAHLKEKEDADFVAYYTKVVQLSQFVRAVLSAMPKLPEELKATGQELQELSAAEILALRSRHEEAVFKEGLRRRSAKLDREMIFDEDENTPLDAEITIGERINTDD